jgi:hypothetical protein
VLTSGLEAAQLCTRDRWHPHFARVINHETPWAPPRAALSEATVTLVSACGLHSAETQLPFDVWNDAGDPSFREIHLDTPADRLRISHSRYGHSVADCAGDRTGGDSRCLRDDEPRHSLERRDTSGAARAFSPWRAAGSGRATGKTQMAVIRETLALLDTATEPAVIVESAVEWPE